MRFDPRKRQLALSAVSLLCVAAVPVYAEPPRPPAVAVSASPNQTFFEFYAINRDQGRPNLITESFLVHAVSLTALKAQRSVESTTLVPQFSAWVSAMEAAARGNPDLRLVRFLAVLKSLASGAPVSADPIVKAELELIAKANGVHRSSAFDATLDYSQFKPRGYYAAAPELSRYFQALRFAEAPLFLLVPSQATGVTAEQAENNMNTAVGLSRLALSPDIASKTEALERLSSALFGDPEDFGPLDLKDSLGQEPKTLRQTLIADAQILGRSPSVIDVLLDADKLNGLTPSQASISWRLAPGRRLSDVAALQDLSYPATGELNGKASPFGLGIINGKPVKAYVGLDDVMALSGQPTAAWNASECEFDRMHEAIRLGREALATSPSPYVLFLNRLSPSAAPALRLALAGGYVDYRRANLLYAKQSYSPTPKSLRLDPERKGAQLDASVAFCQALRALVEDNAKRLPSAEWGVWNHVLVRLEKIARRSGHLSTDDETYLNGLDEILVQLVDRTDDQPVVVDIHTAAAERKVVQIALGYVEPRKSGEAFGADFSVYQFKQPMNERLTDAEWIKRLSSGASVNRWLP